MNKNDIDISIAQPPKDKKTPLQDFLFYLVQWTWGLPVNLVGGAAYLICTKILKRRHQKFGYANIVYLPWNAGGLSMGLFIFIKDNWVTYFITIQIIFYSFMRILILKI